VGCLGVWCVRRNGVRGGVRGGKHVVRVCVCYTLHRDEEPVIPRDIISECGNGNGNGNGKWQMANGNGPRPGARRDSSAMTHENLAGYSSVSEKSTATRARLGPQC
jgi:hypothetical protein